MQRRGFLALGLHALVAPAFVRAAGTEIVACAIHPAVGIARVGNSPDRWFLGPEVPGRVDAPPGGYKDAEGRLARQAVRFRVYGIDARGRVVRELTADDAEITWTVELANTKAAWYDFMLPLDLAEARTLRKRIARRNAALVGADRAGLEIRPGPKSLSGTHARAPLDGGHFMGRPVSLGELRTDEAGRLVALGGLGTANPRAATDILRDGINNDGWHDDTSDGYVEARVRFGGVDLPVRGAWLVVAPPAFAPGIAPIITLYDRMIHASGDLRARGRPSFARDIYPVFHRLTQHQWVNAGFAREFGFGTARDFDDATVRARLADASAANAPARARLLAAFRRPRPRRRDPLAWPSYYGDHIEGPDEHLALLPHQYRALERWARGDFLVDVPRGEVHVARTLDELATSEQPAALDRAQLDAASGGPFHPGIEVGWVVRARGLYEAPLRFRRRTRAEADHGPGLSPRALSRPHGALDGVAPGDLTRWLGVPWQMDAFDCGAGYEPEVDPYLPAFWPASIPNDVLTSAQYARVLGAASPEEVRTALAPSARRRWARGSGEDADDVRRAFVERWPGLGIVTARAGRPDGPEELFVESERTLPEVER